MLIHVYTLFEISIFVLNGPNCWQKNFLHNFYNIIYNVGFVNIFENDKFWTIEIYIGEGYL